MRVRHRGRAPPGRLRRTLPDHHPSDDDTEERAINILIDLDDDSGHFVHDYERNRRFNLDDHDPANVATLINVLRALHDRRPALYHGGEPDDDAAACTWCAELAAAAGDGVTP